MKIVRPEFISCNDTNTERRYTPVVPRQQPDPTPGKSPSEEDYRRLLEFRSGLRRFLRWSEHAAAEADLNPAVHQLLLVIRGCDVASGPSIGDIAQHLVIRHNTAVEVIDRAERDGLVRRDRDGSDSRVVRIRLTPDGLARLEALTEQHLDELRRLSPTLAKAWRGLDD